MNYEDMTKQFESLHEKEKNALLLYKSEFKNLFNSINNNPDFNYYYEKYKTIIINHSNPLIEPVFKSINFNSLEDFIESIYESYDLIETLLQKIKIKEDITLYGLIPFNEGIHDNIFTASMSLIETINKVPKDKKMTLVEINMPKNSLVGCIPYSIDFEEDGKLTLNTKDKEEEVLLLTNLYNFDIVNELDGNNHINIVNVIEYNANKKEVLKR